MIYTESGYYYWTEMFDLVFTNALILTENSSVESCIAVKDGKIAAVEEKLGKGKKTVDVEGKLIAPGLVDLHVHFREPGFTQKEDFLTGTRAATVGGVTTVLDEPNNSPVTNSWGTIKEKKSIIEGKAYVDYSLQMAAYADKLDEIGKARENGIYAFPIFDELGGRPTGMNDTGTLYKALNEIKRFDGLALLNCRESDLVVGTIKELRESGRNSLSDYMDHFPHVAESVGGAKRILLSHEVGAKAHFREVSTEETVQMLRTMKEYLRDITVEVRPDHLFLNRENTKELGPYAQQWTPLRTRKDSKALWGALNDGTVQVIASDHATHTEEEKRRGMDNIWYSPPGLPAIESMLPLLLTAVSEKRISLERVFECTSTNPAKILGLYPMKGSLRVGSDADLVILDLEKKSVIRGKESKAKTHWTPYEGWETKGVVQATYVRGIRTYENGEIIGKPGQGAYISL